MTDLEARAACKTILALAATNLAEGKNALRKVRAFVATLSLEDDEPAPSRKLTSAPDRMERGGSNRKDSV